MDMKNNKEILKHCPKFYDINNFSCYEDDTISSRLIDLYNSYVFGVSLDNDKEIKNLELIDTIIYKYIEDYKFRKQIRKDVKGYNNKNGINVIDFLINCYENYEGGYTRNIYFARWI